jgi:hypothetical protein
MGWLYLLKACHCNTGKQKSSFRLVLLVRWNEPSILVISHVRCMTMLYICMQALPRRNTRRPQAPSCVRKWPRSVGRTSRPTLSPKAWTQGPMETKLGRRYSMLPLLGQQQRNQHTRPQVKEEHGDPVHVRKR